MSSKRSRSDPRSTYAPSPSPEPTPKAVRTVLPPASSATDRYLLCTLPPTCNPPHNRPTHLANSSELEAHYATYHAHVCEEKGCNCVFPDARLLELHQTECHNPLAAVRKDRGEKIFACHIPTCPRRFLTPKTRRLHLIQSHGYPKEYFFAVTNKGVGGLLKVWGEGASMIRGQWKAREQAQEDEDADTESEEENEAGQVDTALPDKRMQEDLLATTEEITEDKTIDPLTFALDALSLVPTNVKFGRGAKRGAASVQNHVQHTAQGHYPRGMGRGRVNPRLGGALRGRGVGRGGPGASMPLITSDGGVANGLETRRQVQQGPLGSGNLRRGGFPAIRMNMGGIGRGSTSSK